MFSPTSLPAKSNSRRTATLCSVALHATAVAAVWAASQAVTAPAIPRYEPREAVSIVSPPPQLFRPRLRRKTKVRRFNVERTAVSRTPEAVRVEPQAPKLEARTDPSPQAERFGAAVGRLEPTSTAPPGGPSGFGTAGLAKTPSLVARASDGGFGGVEIALATRRAGPGGSAGFGAAQHQAAITPSRQPVEQPSHSRPLKILWKPVPQYSEEGLRRRIEGDVVLLVRFLAQGRVETLEVVSGLGHGLDEYALEAAEAIRFEPAAKDDQPVDLIAQVHIRFELAY